MSKYLAWGLSFATGCAVMVLEIAASRVMSPIVGSSLYTWTAIIGTVLLGLSIGAYAGGLVIDRNPSQRTLMAGFFIASSAALLVVFLSPVAPILVQTSFSVPLLTTLIAFLLFLPVSFILGALQPMILRLSVGEIERLGSAYGALSAVWSLGSIIGVFLAGFFLIPTLGTTKTILLVAALLALAGASMAKKGRPALLLMVVVSVSALWGSTNAILGSHVVYAKDTAYYRAVVVDAPLTGYGDSRILFLDLDTHSIARGEETSAIYTDTTRLLESIRSTGSTTLFIGAGAYIMPNGLASTSAVTVVEVDPEVHTIAKEYFSIHPNITTVIADARVFLGRDPHTYDRIVGDAFASYSSVPWHLMTKEFFALVNERLLPGGVYVMNIISGRAGEKGKLFRSVDETLQSVFPYVERYAFGGSPEDAQNIVFLASSEPLTPIVEAGESISVTPGSTLMFESLRIPPSTEEALILTDDHAPTEELLLPVTRSALPLSMRLYLSLTQG